ncbi:two component transcriptional regulator, LuxR family [Gottschalkia purinilytica]|uniref:Two component transcriptional regulator, LuxR family n=1 Tax=Gottschalkia purinilytica TaxID=1503 RepID=A0A0L0WA87_GOTPU|nr:response regulator transcription factor [Gottschalkia purinilytica]KNF08210.1 two component transcriptional regulator, LuxR family [Gottschalkia purinilytica]
MIRVLIADDQSILREGLKMILSAEENIEICGLASDGKEAYDMCKIHNPDIVLMDIKMSNMNGVESTKLIKRDLPDIKIIVLTTFNDDEYIFDALRYGAIGYMLKDSTPEKIAEAIRTVYNGGALIQPDIALKVLDKFASLANYKPEYKIVDKRISELTDRETVICKLIGEGKNNGEIAKELFLSEGTVKNHITNILDKLDLRDRTQLAIFVLKNM